MLFFSHCHFILLDVFPSTKEVPMKVNGIIAEYNPFHNGHSYQLKESLRLTEADYTIVAMSGNFVQRGAPALLSKHARTEMALRAGADLVLELPTLYATSSAEYFAKGGVTLLDKLGVVTHLCFGSECGDIKLLQEIATILSNESEEYSATLKRFLSQGFSYPNARNWALVQHYPHMNEHQRVFSSPNNILGIEYCKALLSRESNITPFTIKRAGGEYHSRGWNQQLCSALAIRHALQEGCDISQVCTHIPKEAAEILTNYMTDYTGLTANDFSSLLYYKLLSEQEKGYEEYWDVSSDISDRIRKRLFECKDYDSFCDLLKTKEVTHTRISRCLLHILLNITKADMELGKSLDYVPYARVLGFRKDSAELLGVIKEHSSIPLISKLADAENILDENAYRLLKKDILVSEIYQGLLREKLQSSGDADATLKLLGKNEFTTPIVIV